MKPNCLWLTFIILQFAFNAGAQAIVQIASDVRESYFVKSDGSLWRGTFSQALTKQDEKMQRLSEEIKDQLPSVQRFNRMRELSSHFTSDNRGPVDLIVSNGVTAVAMNGQHDTFFVKEDGSLWAMGNNAGGHLGDGTFDDAEHPIQIVASGVTAVACSESFTIFLKNDGSVWGFGWNGDGAMGDGTKGNFVTLPKQLTKGDAVAIAAGYHHSVFIKRDGSLWGMGGNSFGQLGLGTNVNQTLFPAEIVASNVVSIAAGPRDTLFCKADGSLWAMGENQFGKLGDCNTEWVYRPKQIVAQDVVAVTAGENGSLFLKKNGSLWGMGINWGTDYGEGIEFNSECPVQIFAPTAPALVAGYYYNARLKNYSSIWAGKFNKTPAPTFDAGGINANPRHILASSPGYNSITIEPLKDGKVRLSYSGDAGIKYALERSSSLVKPNWVPLITNTTPIDGLLAFTNTPDMSINNFWRIRSLQ